MTNSREPRDFFAKEQYRGQPVRCPACCKLFSAVRLNYHLAAQHKIS